MFTLIIQLLDLIYKGTVGLFFSFSIISWAVWGVNKLRRRQYKGFSAVGPTDFTTSFIVPVYHENIIIWAETLRRLKKFAKTSQVIVVQNGADGGEADLARAYGFIVMVLPKANKREAIAEAMPVVTGDISFILDSDTWIDKDTSCKMLIPFLDDAVGGATPRQEIFTRHPLMRRISDWLEDMRFHNTVMGQSVDGSVSCLPGRFVAIRTYILKAAIPEFLRETFMGVKCITGDDRFLTSFLLRNGHKTVYQADATVKTDSPVTLRKFIQQRLRWSRSSLRETILSVGWIFRYPYTAFTVFTSIIIRWFYFIVLAHALYLFATHRMADHVFWHMYPSLNNTLFIIAMTVVGFVLSGLIRQVGHLRRYPHDLPYVPVFLFINTFILLPVEWYGNLTCWKNSWMTRNV